MIKETEGPFIILDKILVPMCADLLHPGHIKIIGRAAMLGAVVVGLHSDQFIKQEKGHPPTMPFEERKEILLALRDVRQVIELKSWHIPKEYIYVAHGDDWRPPYIFKGVYIEVPHTPGVSSSQLKERIGGHGKN